MHMHYVSNATPRMESQMHAYSYMDKMSRMSEKHIFGYVRPAKIQISLRIRAVWSESSPGAFG